MSFVKHKQTEQRRKAKTQNVEIPVPRNQEELAELEDFLQINPGDFQFDIGWGPSFVLVRSGEKRFELPRDYEVFNGFCMKALGMSAPGRAWYRDIIKDARRHGLLAPVGTDYSKWIGHPVAA